jgi:hypothetical protein
MVKLSQISLIALVAIGIGALLVPATSLAPSAYASHHISVSQHVKQKNDCYKAHCENENSQHVSVDNSHSSVSVSQGVSQSNDCSQASCSNENSQSVHIG